jgi:hypothetical protein
MSFENWAVPAFRPGWTFYTLPEGAPIATDDGYTPEEEAAYWATLDSLGGES